MQEDGKESVTETQQPEQNVSGEGGGAQDAPMDKSVDELLDEFDQNEQQPTPQAETPTDDVAALRKEVDAMKQEKNRVDNEKYLEQGVTDALGLLKEHAGGTYSETELTDIAWGKIAQDKKLYNAFVNRDAGSKEKAAFKKIFQTMGKELSQRGKVDDKATRDVEAVTAAVRGSSNNAPAPDHDAKLDKAGDLSEQEWTQMKADIKRGAYSG